jgi:spermidine synthase
MEVWFSERFRDSLQLSCAVKQVLYQKRSLFQDVVVLDTIPFGRMLVLDGCVMTTEKDEFVYHEMISHIGLLAHPKPKTVCIIGGGDGGTVREVLKHSCVEQIVLAEIDEDVVNVCKEFFPTISCGLNDPRVHIEITDGIKYLEEQRNAFDAILSDSTDPIGPGAVLFDESYFSYARRALKEGGFFTTQCESVWTNLEGMHDYAGRLRKFFHTVMLYGASIPTYPSGYWNFLIGSETLDPQVCADLERQKLVGGSAKYYTPAHQTAAFAVPRFAR